MSTDVVLVLSTVSTAADADRIAGRLVEQRLAACVNVVPGVMSVYRWKGAVQRDTERLLVIKTTAGRLEDLRRELVGLHPYELPEVIVLPVGGGHLPYLDWIRESVG